MKCHGAKKSYVCKPKNCFFVRLLIFSSKVEIVALLFSVAVYSQA